jgi:hypothetical protein
MTALEVRALTLIPRSSVDLQPERSAATSAVKVLDRERKTYVRSESPQSYESGSHSHPSRRHTVQLEGTPGVGILDRSIDTFPSAIYPPYMGDAHQRRSTRRIDSGFGATRQSLVTRAGTGPTTAGIFTSRRDAPTVLLDPAISFLYGSLDPRDEGQSGAAPIFEEQ